MINKLIVIVFALMFVFGAGIISAQATEGLGDPGITPDSAFYFIDRAFDWSQSAESLANEKAAEVAVMAQEGEEEAMNRSLGLYEGVMERMRERAQNNEDVSERVANVTTTHLIVLEGLLDQVPEEARFGIETALNTSSQGRETALNALQGFNPERAETIRNQTSERIRENVSEEARERFNINTETASAAQTGQQENPETGQQGGFFDY